MFRSSVLLSKASDAFCSVGRNRIHNKRPPPTNGIPLYIWSIAGGTVTLLGVSYFAFLDRAPITKRKRWIATSPEWERRLGDQEYRRLLSHFKRDVLPPTHPASITVNRVGRRISDAALDLAKRNNIETYNVRPYTYTVVRSEMANAFVLPGNHVFVMTGLFRYVRDEDELAAILGHEMAHNMVRHVGEKISGSVVVNVFARLSLLMDPSGTIFTLMLPAASLFRELPNSRTQELEADEIGLLLAADACYDPRAAKRVFVALKSGESEESSGVAAAPPEFLSTHPSHDSRITNLDTKLIPQAMTIFQADNGDRCHEMREKMSMARKAAFRQQQRQQ